MKYAKIENGTVKIFNTLPRIYENIVNFQKAEIETLNDKGFFELVIPTITEHQRYGALSPNDFDAVNEVWVKPIIDFTQAEIDAHNEQKLDSDSSASKLSNHKSDGQLALKRIWDKIVRLNDNGQLTSNQFNTISNLLFDAVLPLEFGLWKVAQSKVNALPTASGILETIRVTVKEIIDNYITENY